MVKKQLKSFLECMFGSLDDLSEGTDCEVYAELEHAGIDVEKAKNSFKELIKRLNKTGGCDE